MVVFAELCEEVRDEVLIRKAGAEVRAFTLVLLGLVLRAAASGVVHSSAAEVSRTLVFSFVNESIAHTSQEMKNPRDVPSFDRAELLPSF